MSFSPLFVLEVLLLVSVPIQAVELQLFRDVNFKGAHGLIYEFSAAPSNCHDLPEYAQGEIGSVVSDTCLILYESLGCGGNSFKLSRDMADQLKNLRRKVYSFHVCNAQVGGDIIRLDMFEGNKLLAEYNDICGCQDLPSQVATSLNRLNNYGNCIAVYSSDSCSGTKTEISGGQNPQSENLEGLGYYVRSVSACGSRATCVRLDASIFKFVIHIDSDLDESSSELKLGQTTKFFNNGSATLIQEYEAKQTIRETTKVSVTKSIKEMRGHRVEKTRKVDVSVGVDIPIPKTTLALSIGVNVGYAASSSFGEGSSEEESESNTYVHVEEKEFTASQRFEVPPCVEYSVSSTVKMVEDYPIVYEVFSKVTGEASGRRLSAQEVATRVDGMTFVEYYDEYTAIFKATETMIANMGVETVITAEGNDITGCVP